MLTLSDEDKKILLWLARSAIAARLASSGMPGRPERLSPELTTKRGCFVTLHRKGDLRGCIGTIEPVAPLFDCVEENAVNAAFRDPRFPQLKAKELDEIEIEISVLTVPVILEFDDAQDLKDKLIPGVHGVILSRGGRRATFLPQVWEQLPDKDAFMGHLCRKAGLPANSWMDRETTIKVYTAEYFSENK